MFIKTIDNRRVTRLNSELILNSVQSSFKCYIASVKKTTIFNFVDSGKRTSLLGAYCLPSISMVYYARMELGAF